MDPSGRVEGGICLSPEDEVVIPEVFVGEEGTEGISERPSNGGSRPFAVEGLCKRVAGGLHGSNELGESRKA